MKAQRGKRDGSTLSLTAAPEGVGGQRHASAALPPGKTRYPLYRRLGRPNGRSGIYVYEKTKIHDMNAG